MPIYEYQCTKCGEVFEAFQKINDKPLRQCKFCHGKVDRLISQSSFQLKGGGWYLTDYARKSKPPSGSDSGSKPPSSSDSGSKPSDKGTKSSESSSTKAKSE